MALWRRLLHVFRREQTGRDLDDELRFHLQQEAELLAGRGIPADEARRRAARAFGSVSLARENTRAVWVWGSLERLWQDLTSGVMILRTAPALSATAVLLLALVIGGNTTVFSLAHAFLHKPAPGVHAANLYRVNWLDERGFRDPVTSYPNYLDLEARLTTLSPVSAFLWRVPMTLVEEHGSHAVSGTLVSPRFFDTLDVALERGRTFAPEEYEGSQGLTVVISHRAWREFFDSAPDVVGRAVTINTHPAAVIGVAADGFRGTMQGESVDLWLPLVGYARLSGQGQTLVDRRDFSVALIGRLADGRSLAEAHAEISGVWSGLQEAYPDLDRSRAMLVPYSAVGGSGTGVDFFGPRLLALFSVVTVLTIVIVGANVANLLLARAVVRQRELALRQALGASRVRLARALFAEAGTLAGLACAASLVFAWWVSYLASGTIRVIPGLELRLDLAPDSTVAAYAIALGVVAIATFSLAPLLRIRRLNLLPLLKAGEPDVVRGRSRISTLLVVVQLAFAVLLLTASGLVVRSLILWSGEDPGFEPKQLVMLTLNTAGVVDRAEEHAVLVERVRERLSAVPGVERVSHAHRPLFRDGGWLGATVRMPGSSDEPIQTQRNHVGPEFLATLGVTGVGGREFESRPPGGRAPGAVLSEALARDLWPDQNPIGRTLVIRYRPDTDYASGTTVPLEYEVEVIGVSPPFSGSTRDDRRLVLLSSRDHPSTPGELTFYIRYADGTVQAAAVTRALREVDTRLPVVSLDAMDTVVDRSAWPLRVLMQLLLLFSIGSLLIAAVGQYGIVSFDMRRRRREMGLRLALGATPQQVLRAVVRQGFRTTIIGLIVGLALSAAVGMAIRGALFGVTPLDPLTYAGVAVALFIASLIACYLPARRTAQLDPAETLRSE